MCLTPPSRIATSASRNAASFWENYNKRNWKNLHDMFSRFGTISERERQTDWQTNIFLKDGLRNLSRTSARGCSLWLLVHGWHSRNLENLRKMSYLRKMIGNNKSIIIFELTLLFSRYAGRYYVTLLLNRELVSRLNLCPVSVFPDIVKDCPKMRNLPKIFPRMWPFWGTTLDADGEDALGGSPVSKQRVTPGTRHHVLPDVQPLSSTVDEVTAASRQWPGGTRGHRWPEGDFRTRHKHRTSVTTCVHERSGRTRLHQRHDDLYIQRNVTSGYLNKKPGYRWDSWPYCLTADY